MRRVRNMVFSHRCPQRARGLNHWTSTMSQPVGSIDPSTVPGGSGGYELHQKIRTKTVRLLKKEKYDDAINVLYDGSMKLLDMNEQGSGCDLAVYLLEAYNLSKTPVNEVSRGMFLCSCRSHHDHPRQNQRRILA